MSLISISRWRGNLRRHHVKETARKHHVNDTIKKHRFKDTLQKHQVTDRTRAHQEKDTILRHTTRLRYSLGNTPPSSQVRHLMIKNKLRLEDYFALDIRLAKTTLRTSIVPRILCSYTAIVYVLLL